MVTKGEAYDRLRALELTLEKLVEGDPEQDVLDFAVPVIDAAFAAARQHLAADDPLLGAAADLVSPERVETGEPVRAVDALIVVGQLRAALYEPVRPASSPTYFLSRDDDRPGWLRP